MKRKTIRITALTFIVIASVFILFFARNWKTIIDPTPHPLRTVSTIINLNEGWKGEDIFVGGKTLRGSNGFLEINPDAIYYLNVSRNFLGQDWTLRKQRIDGGKILWEQNIASPVRVAQMRNNKIFVITSKQTACGLEWKPECESIIVTSYDANDGQQIWAKTYDGLLNVEMVEIDDSSMKIHGSSNRGNFRATYLIDATNGDFLQSTDSQYGLKEMIDVFSNPQPLSEILDYTPISNIVSQNGFTYFVSDESQLLVITEDTNTVFASAEFVPNKFFVPPNTITVLVEESKIIVYFEDSRQLFTFDISDM